MGEVCTLVLSVKVLVNVIEFSVSKLAAHTFLSVIAILTVSTKVLVGTSNSSLTKGLSPTVAWGRAPIVDIFMIGS